VRWFRAFLAALSETPPDDGRELARNQALAGAVFTCEAIREWAENVRDSADAMPQEYRPGMGKAAADVLRILDAG
jgi:hypothetical protein